MRYVTSAYAAGIQVTSAAEDGLATQSTVTDGAGSPPAAEWAAAVSPGAPVARVCETGRVAFADEGGLVTTPRADAYIQLPDPRVTAAGRPADHPYNFGFVTGMSRLLTAHPRIGPPFLRLFAEIMFAPGALDRQEREFVAAVAASAQNCFY